MGVTPWNVPNFAMSRLLIPIDGANTTKIITQRMRVLKQKTDRFLWLDFQKKEKCFWQLILFTINNSK
jgi:hypothetical protein